MSEYDYQGTKNPDRAVLLAHGAGSDRRGAALVTVADALEEAGVASLRFDYPYRVQDRRAPDRPAVLDAATRAAVDELTTRSGLAPERLVLGGRSMGGRVCSMVVGDPDDPVPALGLMMLGYPLQPAGKPERRRDEHFPRLKCPVLFVSGTRDALAPKADLTRSARKIKGDVTFHWLETADHGFRPLKSSGRSPADVLAEVAETCVTWMKGLT
jgi:predicted alpha/beta-hydrolase family hydrolase